LLLTQHRAAFAALTQDLSAESDGCMVDQTGGIRVIRATGPRAPELLLRLGSAASVPDLGEAHSGRLAELNVLTASVRAGEYLLLVEGVYTHHLLEFMRVTALDL
jgi:hypothetical protein